MGKNIIDQYSYLHFAVGIILFYWDIDIITAIILHTIFEIVENTKLGMHIINNYIYFWPGGKPYPDSLVNCISDTVFFILGWISALLINKLSNNLKLYNKY